MNAEDQTPIKKPYSWSMPPENDASELIELIGAGGFRERIFSGDSKSAEKSLGEIARILSEQSGHKFGAPYISGIFAGNDVFDADYGNGFLRFEKTKPGVYRIEDISYWERLGC